MKTWWNILICIWISVIHGEEHVNADEFLLTSSPLPATDGELFTLICSFRNESIVNIGWLQNNKPNVVTQKDGNCIKQALGYGQDIINRINVSCNTTDHSMSFRFSSTTDQGAVWQCGKQVTDYDIRPRSNNYTIGTDGHGHTASPVMSTQSLSTTTRNMETASDPLTLTTKNGTSSSTMSTQSLSTKTRTMEITSDQETVTTKDGTSSSTMSTQSLSTTTRTMEITSDQETVTTKDAFTGEKDPNLFYIVFGAVGGAVLLTVVAVGVVCIRRRRKAARQQKDMKEERKNKATTVYQNTSDCNTVENDLYEGSRDVQPMNAAENHEDDFMLSGGYASVDMPVTNTCTPQEEVPSGGVNLENLSPVYQNTTGNITVENDLYEGSRDVQPMNAAENHEDDFMLSDAYASADLPVTNTCTPQEEVPSGDLNLDNLYAKPDKSKHSEVQHVSDIYAAVQKPKKNKQDDPMVSEDFNTGDVYAKPNKCLKAQK